MDVFKAIMERRSIRHFKPDPVSEKDLNQVLEAARWAPSWHNFQVWRFVIVTDPGMKSRLAETVVEGNQGAEAIRQAPVVIVACGEKGKSGYIKGEKMDWASDKGDWYMFDVALAVENMALTACALGLGTLNVGWMDAPKAGRIIGVPDGVEVIEMIPLGYPDGTGPVTKRKPLEEIVYYERYGQGKK